MHAFGNSVWDEDLGVLVTMKGVNRIAEVLQNLYLEGWKIVDIAVSEHGDGFLELNVERKRLRSKLKNNKKRKSSKKKALT